jgi:hypothetical protein
MKSILLSLWLWITQPIVRFIRSEYKRYKGRPAALLKAIAKAKHLHKKAGKHYKVYFLENRYQVLTRNDIQYRKFNGEFLDFMNVTKMSAISFFDTQSGLVSGFACDLLKTKYSGLRLLKLGIVQPLSK